MLLILGGPIAIGFWMGQPKISAIPTLSALFVGLVKVNGTYQRQAKATGIAAVGITLALLVANLVSPHFWLAIATTFTVIFLLGLAGLYGNAAASISLVISIMFIISLAKFASFPNLNVVLEQCLLCLAGGLWAVILSSSLGIIRPYKPARRAVASCYLSLSDLAELAKERIFTDPNQSDWAKRFLQAQDAAIQNLTAARDIWTSVWTREQTDSPRGSQLLVCIEDANQIIHALVALVELIEIASGRPSFVSLQLEIEQATRQVAISLQQLSAGLKKDRKSILLGDLERSVEALEHQWHSLRHRVYQQTAEIQTDDYADLVNLRKIVISLSDLSQQIHMDAETVMDLSLSSGQSRGQSTDQSKSQSKDRSNSFFLAQPAPSFWLDSVKDNLTFNSFLFRHALRLAIVITLAQCITYWLPIPRGYWIALTALVALKPNFGGTFEIIGQRVLGTIVGGIVGIALVNFIHGFGATTFCILLLMFVAMSLRALSYSIFITLFTPAVILLLSAIGSGGWEVGVTRIVDVLIGGALALLGSYFLFPSWEWQQLPAQLERTIRANLAYFEIAIAQPPTKSSKSENETFNRSLHRLRHQAALENANAEAASQRLFSEPRHVRGEVEPVMALMLYIRSLFSSVTTLTEHVKGLNGAQPEEQPGQIRELSQAIEQVLNNLADALNQEQQPLPLPPLERYVEALGDRIEQLHTTRISEIAAHQATITPTLQAIRHQTPVATELKRIVRAITVMHCTLDRMIRLLKPLKALPYEKPS